MTYPYNNRRYNPPAPVLPITVHTPGDSTKQVTIDALVDTGADITCLPRVLVNVLDAERASTYEVFGIGGVRINRPADSYFLEFEIGGVKKLVEVIAVGDEPILGRNLLNEFTIRLDGPTQKLGILSEPK